MQTQWEDEVRTRAYAIWQQEGQPEGRADEHWLKAEAELAAERLAAQDWAGAVRQLRELSDSEYGLDLAELERPSGGSMAPTDKAELGFTRLARLIGVSIKQPMADPQVPGFTATGARHGWVAVREKVEVAYQKNLPEYQVVVQIFSDFFNFPGGIHDPEQVYMALRDSSEFGGVFNWLHNSVKPKICTFKRSDVLLALSASGVVSAVSDQALASSVQALVTKLVIIIPQLAGWPIAVLTGLAVLLTIYGIDRFCNWEYQGQQVVET